MSGAEAELSNLSMMFNQLLSERPVGEPPVVASVAQLSDRGAELPTAVIDGLRGMDLLAAGDRPQARRLPSSPASEVFEVRLGWGTVCIKRALPEEDGTAATLLMERSLREAQWLRFARSVVSESVPEVLGTRGAMLALEYLETHRHARWHERLRDGEISPSTAAEAGRLAGRLHAADPETWWRAGEVPMLVLQPLIDALASLDVGQSVFVPVETCKAPAQYAARVAKQSGAKFVCRKAEEKARAGHRIWRFA